MAPSTFEYFPLLQSTHAPDPVSALKVPRPHAVQLAPSGPVYPLLHLQSVAAVLPEVDEESAGQLVHDAVPGWSLYFPLAHSSHGPPSGPNEPALHCNAHSLCAVAPGGVVFPLGHDWQLALPVPCLYCPDWHNEHGPPLLPVAPALQEHLVEAVLAAGEFECVGHAEHVLTDVAPMVGEKVPTPQS